MAKRSRNTDIIIAAVILLILAGSLLLLLMMPENERENESSVSAELTLSDFNGKRAGVVTGSFHDTVIRRVFPESSISEYNTVSDLITALISDKIDFFLNMTEAAAAIVKERPELTYIDIPVERSYMGAMFPKTSESDKLRAEFDEFVTSLKNSGTLDSITEYWKSDDASGRKIDMGGLNAENGTINFANNTINPPMSYISEGGYAGVEPDIMVRFCREYGYGLNLIDVDTSGILSGIASGMYDIAMGNMVITEERRESANFSVPYNSGELVLITLNGTSGLPVKAVPAITVDELNSAGRKVGVGIGTAGMYAVEKYLPDAKELMLDSVATAVEALRAGKIDAYVYDRRQLQIALDNGASGVMLLDENLGEPTDVAVGLSRATKISGLEDSINRFIAEKKADGTLDDMYTRWASNKNYTMPEIAPAASLKFTIVVGTSGVVEPYSFYCSNILTGYDIEMASRFAAWLGADIKFKVFDYTGIINVTDERREVIDFSDPIYSIENGIMVAAVPVGKTVSEQSWLDSIILSFEKNFIREDRWKLIVEGIGTTCFITVLSAIFGSVLAFLICIFRRTGSRLANAVSNIYVKLLQGTPIVVLLMILYYLVLGKSGLAAEWVAVIGFTLNFGAYASEIMRSGIESIDAGQREAALALGYSEHQTFFRFILPQAAVRFLPVYNGEIVSLLKSTSIVGYIAIQDLTKMSDIIRSRTYEAFFPLIATAVIYFILAWLISLLLKFILKKVSPVRKTDTAK